MDYKRLIFLAVLLVLRQALAVDVGRILSPIDGAIDIDGPVEVEISLNVSESEAVHLRVGRTFGEDDIYLVPEVLPQERLRFTIPSVPESTVVHVALIARTAAGFKRTLDQIAFRSRGSDTYQPVSFICPDQGIYPQDRPLRWSTIPWAIAYRVQVHRPDTLDPIFDSGPIGIDFVYPPPLPSNVLLKFSVGALVGGRWIHRECLAVAVGEVSRRSPATDVVTIVGHVRNSASADSNYSLPWSLLRRICETRSKRLAVCQEYSEAVVEGCMQARIPGEARIQHVAFIDNQYEVHTIAQWRPDPTIDWMIADATFGFCVTDPAGNPISAIAMQKATIAREWKNIRFVQAANSSEMVSSGYYLDYPLLFLFVERNGRMMGPEGCPQLPFLEPVETGWSVPHTAHFVHSPTGEDVTVSVGDGSAASLPVDGSGFSRCIHAGEVRLVRPPASRLYRARRFIFLQAEQ